MRIAVVGCGALGSYYGAMLLRAGHDVAFLTRSDHEVVSRDGVRVLSAAGDFHVRPRCSRTPGGIGVVDLVLVGLKTTANDRLGELLPPLASAHTALLTLQNGLGNEEALEALFPVAQVMGGLCFVSINRLAPGLIRHIDNGRVVLGEFRRPPEPRTHAVAAMFRDAGVPCEVSDDIVATHWRKLVWNIGFNGLGVAGVAGLDAVLSGRVDPALVPGPVLPADVLLREPGWRRVLGELMAETIAVAGALGHAIEPGYAEAEMTRTVAMGAYRASTLVDYDMGRPMELRSIFLFPQEEARRAGVPTPRLDALCAVLRHLGSATPAKPRTPAAS